MPTAQQLLNISAGKLGVTVANTALGADESADGLVVLNSMLDSWRLDRLMVYQITQVSGTWLAGRASNPVGPGSTFIATRPDRLESAFFTDSTGLDRELWIMRERDEYDRIIDKTQTSTYPEAVFYDPTYLTGTLYVYPVPSAEVTVKLNIWQPLQSFPALTTYLMLPPGYQRAIECNLPIELAPFYGAKVSQELAMSARESKATLMRFNAPVGILHMPPGIAGARRYNIYTG
jgi:hypothetical protein